MDRNQYRNPNEDQAPSGDRGLSNNMSIDISINQGLNKTQDYLNRTAAFQMQGLNAFYTFDLMSSLENAKGAFIKQKIEIFEMLSGCETKNVYNVFLRFENNEYAYIFKCKEKSGWFARNCLSSDIRPFDMKVKYVKNISDSNSNQFDNNFMEFEKPCVCTCFCFNRPLMTGRLSSGQTIGKIIQPWTCIDPIWEIYGGDDKHKYVIKPDCCQCGIWGRSFCGKCCETTFRIFTASKYAENSSAENADGTIIRKVGGLAQAILTDADNFEINFPNGASAHDKMMIIGNTLMIDYSFFEDSGNDN